MNKVALNVEAYVLALKAGKKYTDEQIAQAIASLPKYVDWKGAVNYYNDLPQNAEVGDAYTVLYSGTSGTTALGEEYAWGELDGVMQWIPLGITYEAGSGIKIDGDIISFDGTTIRGYDGTKTQVLANNGGVIEWEEGTSYAALNANLYGGDIND